MTKWDTVRLGDAATFVNGFAFKPSDWSTTGLPIIRIQNLTGSSTDINYYDGDYNPRYVVNENDVLISCSASLGVYKWRGPKALLNQHIFKVVFDKKDIDRDYFYRIIDRRINEMLRFVHGSTMKHITKKHFDNIEIPLPPLSEQRRLAAILDEADAIRKARAESLRRLDELVKSTFLDMFGDPVSNPMGWDVKRFGELCDDFRYGTNNKCDSVQIENALPILRIPNVVRDTIDFNDLVYTTLSSDDEGRYLLKPGDILFVRTNGNPEYIGRCAVFTKRTARYAYASYLIRARLSSFDHVIPVFVQNVISFPTFRRIVIKEAKTTAGNYNINTEGLRNLKLFVPPISLQEKFVSIVAEVDRQKESARTALTESEQLFASLSQRAFRGEL